MLRPVWAEVDLEAVYKNITAISGLLEPDTLIMAVVKADAYGHGSVPVAETAVAAGAARLGVALVEEAAELRAAGLDPPIHLLSEPPAEAAEAVVDLDLIPTVYTKTWLSALNAAAGDRGRELAIHIKVDTGMHRVGAVPDQALELTRVVRDDLTYLRLEGVMTHLACADEIGDDYTNEQLETFKRLRADLSGVELWHAANSAGTFFWPQSRLDMVRIGIAMYGLQPSRESSPVSLTPVLSLKTKVAFVHELAAGEGVSYGLTYRATGPQTVAVLPIGYGDGFSRRLSNKGEVLVNGRRARLIGNVCMDQCLIRVEGPVAVGDEVVLIGRHGEDEITAEELADIIGTINYEVVCMLNSRVPRRYVGTPDGSSLGGRG